MAIQESGQLGALARNAKSGSGGNNNLARALGLGAYHQMRKSASA